MNSRDEHFRPESVEEQINNLPQTGPQSEDTTPDGHMLKDLRHVYRSYTQSGERVWERLARHITDETNIVYITDLDEATAHVGNDPFANWQAQTWRSRDNGRSRQMKLATDQANMPGHAAPSRLALIAAGLVVALLVSSLLWVLHIAHSTQIGSEPSTSHGIYLFHEDGVDKLDLQTHQVLWHVAHPFQVSGPMTPIFPPDAEVLGDNLYVFDTISTITAINTQNGAVRWSRTFDAVQIGAYLQPTLSGGLLYMGGIRVRPNGYVIPGQAMLYALDPTTGAIKYTHKLPADVVKVSINDTILYYETGMNKPRIEVYAAQLPSEKPLWHMSISTDLFPFDWQYFNNGIFYGERSSPSPANDMIYAFDMKIGKSLWKYSVPRMSGGVRELFFTGDRIYCTTAGASNSDLYALDAHNGKLIWHQPFDTETLLATPDVLYIHASMHNPTNANDDVGLMALSAKDGTKLWQYSIPGFRFSITINSLDVDGVLYSLVMGNHGQNAAIYAVRASDGKPLWHVPVTGEVLLA